jgi:hypothetical protein
MGRRVSPLLLRTRQSGLALVPRLIDDTGRLLGASVAAVAVLERDRAAAARIARVAAADLHPVAVGSDPAELARRLDRAPRLLACDAADLEHALDWLERWPDLRVLLWSRGNPRRALDVARWEPRIRNLASWPPNTPSPRPAELALVVRRLLDPDLPLPPLDRLVPWGGCRAVFRPATEPEREQAVTAVADRLRAAGVDDRSATRAGEVAHELLSNATYAAPVDGWGRPKYARDRRAPVHLDGREVPTLELYTDGQQLVIEVSDPFGRLDDRPVVAGVARALDNASGDLSSPALDTAGGGAGLGFGMAWASSVALVTEVFPGRSTRVLWFHDLDLHPREYRGRFASLHLFRLEPEAR